MRAEMLLAVLDGRGSAEETATRLGFVATAPLSVLAFELVARRCGARRAPARAARRSRRRALRGLLPADRRRSRSGQTVYALAPGRARARPAARPRGSRERIQAHAEARLGAAAARGDRLDGGGRPRRRPRATRGRARPRRPARRSRREDGRGDRGRARARSCSSSCASSAPSHPGLTRGRLERVLAHDAEHRSAYAATLRAYLDAFGDVGAGRGPRLRPSQHLPLPDAPRLVELFELDLDEPGRAPRDRAAAPSARADDADASAGCTSRRSS